MAASDRRRGPAPERPEGACVGSRGGSGRRGSLRLAGLLWLGWGCLNPQPDDQPHSVNINGAPADVAPLPGAFETCDDNPLLAGCSASSPTDSAAGGSGSGSMNAGAAGSAAAGAAGSSGMAGAAGTAGAAGNGALQPDAGPSNVDARPTDAGTEHADGEDADAP